MEKKVIYKDENDNILFQEVINYISIPPVGRHIIWHKAYWIVKCVTENWDEQTIEVELEQQ